MTSTFAMDLESLSRAQTMESSDADMDDTPASSVHESDMEDGEEGSEEEEEDIPLVTLHPRVGHNVDTGFNCPLKGASKYTIAAAQDSARQGCPSCILRTTTVAEIVPGASGSEEVEGSHDYIFLPFLIQGQRVVLASHEQLQIDEEPLICDFYGDRLAGIDCVERVVPCDTDSPESLKTVKKWLRHCDESHDCTFPNSLELPRRVLDVRNNAVRLHETTPEDRGSRYACLSHCWGNPPETMLKTTFTNFAAHRSAIPWDNLPPTFQHAVSFTRKLGLPFLWIDSLCIIQCNARDWQEQSGMMAQIYQGAYITLAATSSYNADGGCYSRSPKHESSQPLAIVHFPNGLQHYLSARLKFSHDMKHLPLLARAWVYQERVLSPRVLHFMSAELVWECAHAITCECAGANLEYAMERARISASNSFECIGPHVRHPAPLDLWYQIVDEYSGLALSHAGDVFPALSGIAKAFAGRVGGGYVAGMWRGTLVANLLWYAQVGEGDGRDGYAAVRPWRAPSWSWASHAWNTDFRVLPITKALAEILHVSCQPAGADPTGSLASANLTLRTRFTPAYFDPGSKTIHLDDLTIPAAQPKISSYILSELCTCYFSLDATHLTQHPDMLVTQIAECTGSSQKYLYGVQENVHFEQEARLYLLLAKQDGRWVRVGLASIVLYEPEMALFGGREGEDREDVVKGMAREEIRGVLEERAERNRAILRRLDGVEVRDIVVW